MGWWSEDIMGGDTPLDIEDYIYDIVGIEKFGKDTEINPIPKEKFDDPSQIILTMQEKDGGYWLKSDTGNIFYQVLGVMMMKVGAPIDGPLKKKMIKAAQNDEWAEEEEERMQRMTSFIDALNRYDGTEPFVIKSAGLFDKITTHMVSSQPNVTIDTLRELLLAHVEDYRHEDVNGILDQIIEKAKS